VIPSSDLSVDPMRHVGQGFRRRFGSNCHTPVVRHNTRVALFRRCFNSLLLCVEVDSPINPEEALPDGNPAWRRVLLARHPKRPHSLDYIQRLFTDFQEIHGDRSFGDDAAIVAGLGQFDGHPVCVVAEQKGRDTKQRFFRNFGMPKPEGYRKALRVMQLAAKFGRPIVTLLDTPGAYPGIDAEERGQAEAIARNLREMARLPVPVLVICIGEGGSGGALALGVGNTVLMLENAVYSVISPESCAAIIYRDSGKAEQAAAALRLTAEDLKEFGLVDGIIPEPPGGAQEDWDAAAEIVRTHIRSGLRDLHGMDRDEIVQHRYAKFRRMGNFFA
jgi:acetyl-CoA carboxylase carboxyl transferase subunit alpha